MRRFGNGAGLSLLLGLAMLACSAPAALASGLPPGRLLGPDGIEIERPARPSGYLYTIQAGDTLWDIATAHGLMPDDIFDANAGLDAGLLHPGQIVFVPAQPATVPHKTPAPAPATQSPPPAPASAQGGTTAGAPGGTQAAAPNPPAPAAQPAAAAALPASLAGWPEALLKLVNEQRAAYKLPALVWSPELAQAAQGQAADCGRRNFGSHIGSDGAVLRTRLARAGFAAYAASENWANTINVQATFGMWWNEPPGNDPHRRNILDPQYKEIGIGIAPGGWGYFFVADFGSR